MTTIACKNRVMAADSRVTMGDSWMPASKINRADDEIIGMAGDSMMAERWLKWRTTGRRGAPPKMDDVSALILSPLGLFVVSGNVYEMPVESGCHAVGSGGSAARGAMLAGADAEAAVRIAAQIDASTGGEIQTITLGAA